MEKVYAVCWGSGSVDDHDNAHAYSGIVGVYRNKEDALKAMEEYVYETIIEIKNDLDPDGELPKYEKEVQTYGSVKDEYFEIDYTIGTEPVEVYIGISETTLN